MNPKAQAEASRKASRELAALDGAGRSRLLERMAQALMAHEAQILEANAQDLQASEALVASGALSRAAAARLALSRGGLARLAEGLRQLAAMPDPLGRVLRQTELAPGLQLTQQTVPLGVLLIIFESRPDAIPQIAGLAVRSGNGLLLKGGREATASNRAVHQALISALDTVPPEVVGLVHTREEVASLLQLDDSIDLVIPRGSNELVRTIQASTKIPVLGHADGICHVFVDQAADLEMARQIVVDSKTDYPAACNAMETLLVHQGLDDSALNALLKPLRAAGVQLYRGPNGPEGLPEAPSLRHEYGDLACTVERVADLDAAIEHIHAYGSGHTDSIITADPEAAARFLDRVDSACVFHNASTRFADGYRFGLGAEVGISTSRIHARGPVGVDGLLTTRWRLVGQGDTVGPFTSGERRFTHRSL